MVPVIKGRVVHPPVACAAVVGYNVHYHLEAAGVACVHKCLIPGIVSKAGINVVVVRYGISVVTAARLVVDKERSAPNGRSAKVLNVIQVVYHALDIASVAGVGVFPVHLVQHERDLPGVAGAILICALRGFSLSKAVRHDEIDHIGRSEALTGRTAGAAFLNEVRVFETFISPCEHKVIGAGPGTGRNLYVHKDEIRVIGLMHGLHLETGAGNGNVKGRYPRPLHHKLETGFHTGPPTQGLYARYLRGTGLRNGGRVYPTGTGGHDQ